MVSTALDRICLLKGSPSVVGKGLLDYEQINGAHHSAVLATRTIVNGLVAKIAAQKLNLYNYHR